MGRLLGIDYGLSRIGIAVSDEMELIATPLAIIKHKNYAQDVKAINDAAHEYSVKTIILGDPLSLDGNITKQTLECRAFGEYLRGEGFCVVSQNEFYTTKAADELMHSSGKKHQKPSDAIAAALILQDYLDSRRSH